MVLAVAILGLVTLQRLGELVLSRRNTERLLAQGAREVAPGHYPLIVALHAAWLAGLWYLAVWRAAVGVSWAWLAVFVVLQGLRVWVIATLGPRWTTRIIVAARRAAGARGPVPLRVASQLLHRRRRDPGAAALLRPGRGTASSSRC